MKVTHVNNTIEYLVYVNDSLDYMTDSRVKAYIEFEKAVEAGNSARLKKRTTNIEIETLEETEE